MDWITFACSLFALVAVLWAVRETRAHIERHKELASTLDEHMGQHEREVTRPWN